MPAGRLAQILLFCLFLLRLLGYERLVGFTLSCIAYTLPTKEKGMAGPMGLATPVSFEALWPLFTTSLKTRSTHTISHNKAWYHFVRRARVSFFWEFQGVGWVFLVEKKIQNWILLLHVLTPNNDEMVFPDGSELGLFPFMNILFYQVSCAFHYCT